MKYILKIVGWIIIASVIVLIGVADAGFDLTTLNAQVQHHEAILDNHEARITNNEKDIQVLQDTNHTAPALDRVVVKEVAEPATTAPATAAPTTSQTVEAASTPTPTPNLQPTQYNEHGQPTVQQYPN